VCEVLPKSNSNHASESRARSVRTPAAHSRGRLLLVLALVPMLTSLHVAADPPPGAPEVDNTFCASWNNGTGICDDYNFAHDLTTSQEWVRGRYLFEMQNTSLMTLTLEWEVHEFNRSLIGLEGMELGGDFDSNDSGAPADYIRNYLDHTTPQGVDVRDQLVAEFSSAVESLIETSFNGTADVNSALVDQVQMEGVTIQCSSDKDSDSADELAGLPNNAFQPPICLRSVAMIQINTDMMSVGTGGTLNVERAYQGVLTMGGAVTTNFTIFSRPGHRSVFEVAPPPYASISDVGGGGVTAPRQQGSWNYQVGIWVVDNLGAGPGSENQLSNVSMTAVRRATSTSAVDLDLDNEVGIDVEMTIDLRDEIHSIVSTQVAIRYLPRSTLDEWDLSFGSDGVDLPWVTSDGVRMAYHEGLLDIEDFSAAIPMDEVNQLAFDITEIELEMGPIKWLDFNTTGGLNYSHIPGQTCAESVAVNHCLLGGNAMNGTYPIYFSSTSKPFAVDPLEVLTGIIAENYGYDNLTYLNPDDVSAVLSLLVYEVSLDTSFLSAFLPSNLPPTDLTVHLRLPTWIASTTGQPDTITLTVRSESGALTPFGFTGPNPYHERWDDPICERSAGCSDSSADLICRSNWRTCIHVKATLDFSELNVMEWSQAVELVVEGSVVIELYRVALPHPLTDDYGVRVEAIPADMIRHAVAAGDEVEGGLLAMVNQSLEVPLGDQMHSLEISNRGLQSLADSLAVMVNSEIQAMEVDDSTMSADLSGLQFSASVETLRRTPDGYIDDDEPIRFVLTLQKTSILARYNEGMFIVDTSVGGSMLTSLFSGMMGTFDARAAEGDTGGVYTFPPEPLVFDVAPPTQSQDVDSEFDSDGDGNAGNDVDIDFRPVITIDITMPKGLSLEFTSTLGRDEHPERQDGRNQVIYRTPLCTAENPRDCDAQKDEVQIQFTVGYGFIVQELLPYLFGGLGLILLLVVLRMRKRKRKEKILEEQKLIVKAKNVNTHAVERELLGLPPLGAAGGIGGIGGGKVGGEGGGSDSDWFAGLDIDNSEEDW